MSIQGMQLRDILRRDYKEYDTPSGKLGMSTVTRTIAYLREQFPDFAAEYVRFVGERQLAVHVTMTVDGQGETFRRGGMVVTTNGGGEGFVREFERKGGEEYGIQGEFVAGFEDLQGGGDGMRSWVYEQGESSASRKQIAPLAQGIMDTKKS